MNNIDETHEKQVSATVESLKDTDNSTVCIDSYKGRPTIAFNKDSKYPFSFGELKAKILHKHRDAIAKFVETHGKSIT